MRKAKKKRKEENAKNEDVEEQLRTTKDILDTHYVRAVSKGWECNLCLAREGGNKDVNTNLGMMLLPGTLLHENTRIKKKILFWHIFIHKRRVCTGSRFTVKDVPILVASLRFSRRARKQKNER